MLARVVAAQSGASFYQISGPEILSKWVGQTEELLRLLFEAAGAETRSIVFFDEIDSVAVQRDDAQGASRQVVAQLLTLMDGPLAKPNVLVVAATNRPQDLDPALLRPGRFDWKIDFPLPSLLDRLAILEVSAKTHAGGSALPHALIAANTEGWTGAELTGIWSEAALLAVMDGRVTILLEDFLGGFEAVAANRAVQVRVARSLVPNGKGAA
jgi:transitional endoplasmic reticulum ATPase